MLPGPLFRRSIRDASHTHHLRVFGTRVASPRSGVTVYGRLRGRRPRSRTSLRRTNQISPAREHIDICLAPKADSRRCGASPRSRSIAVGLFDIECALDYLAPRARLATMRIFIAIPSGSSASCARATTSDKALRALRSSAMSQRISTFAG